VSDQSSAPKRLIVGIDGKCMLAKAAFAIPKTVRSQQGLPVNGFLGFGLMELRLVEEYPAASFVVAFDTGEASFRDDILPTYKTSRPSLPEGFAEQMQLAKEFSRLIGFQVVDAPKGFEADDVLASLATQALTSVTHCWIVTADKDLLQVVKNPFVRVLLSKRGVTDYESYDEDLVEHRQGVPVDRFADYRALIGDRSDAIPGVPGIGPVTARALVNTYGGVMDILAHSSELHGSVNARLAENATNIERNLRLARLERALPLPPTPSAPDTTHWPIDDIAKITESIGLTSMFRRVKAIVERRQGFALHS
jgi:DNA polymerase I